MAHFFSPERIGFLTQENTFNALCGLIHLFVMPCFFIISGYFAPTEIKGNFTRNLLSFILVPYIVFEIFFKLVVPAHLNQVDLFVESFYTLWFLAVLFLYRVAVPFLKELRIAPLIGLFLLLSFSSHLKIKWLMWGEWNFIKYAPYFLLGVLFKRKHIDLSAYKPSLFIKLVAVGTLMGSGMTLFVLNINFLEIIPDIPCAGKTTGILLLIKTYPFVESISRDAIYRVLGLFLAFSIFSLIPKTKLPISSYGERSLYPYLLHPIAMNLLEKSGYYRHQGWIFSVGLFFLCFFITLFFSANFVVSPLRRFFSWIGNPFFEKPFKKKII